MQSGTIVKTNEKGFGFIKPDGGGKDMFFHVTGMQDRSQFDGLKPDDRVQYTVDQTGDRPRAIDVARV